MWPAATWRLPEDDGQRLSEKDDCGESPGQEGDHQGEYEEDLDGQEPGRKQPFAHQSTRQKQH